MPRIDDYKAAIALAAAELQQINPKRLENRTRFEYFFGRRPGRPVGALFRPEPPGQLARGQRAPAEGGGEIPLTEQILILHYLNRCTGEPLSGRSIDFREVPEAGLLLVRLCLPGQEAAPGNLWAVTLELYLKVARSLGGEPQDLGDAAARFLAFPLVPVTHVLWGGDEEFPPEANILFDATISQHLSTEDIAALAGASVYRLMAAAFKMRK